jgi:hypothetical protein
MAKPGLSKAMFQGKSIAPGRLAYNFPLDEQGIKRLHDLSGRGA